MKYSAYISAVSLTLLLFGCEHIEPMPLREDNFKEGPGLITGEKGEFVITPADFGAKR